MSTFFKLKKKTNLSRRWYGTRERKNLCFVKTLVEIHLVSRFIVLTVSVQYIHESVSACLTDSMFVWLVCMYVCVCMYRHSISDLSTPLTPLSLGEERPLKYCTVYHWWAIQILVYFNFLCNSSV